MCTFFPIVAFVIFRFSCYTVAEKASKDNQVRISDVKYMMPERDQIQSPLPARTEATFCSSKNGNLQRLAEEYYSHWQTNPGNISSCLYPFAFLDPKKYEAMLRETIWADGFGTTKKDAALSLTTLIRVNPDVGIRLFDTLDRDISNQDFKQGLNLVFPNIIEATNPTDAAMRLNNSPEKRVALALGIAALKAANEDPKGALAETVINSYNKILASQINLSGTRSLAARALDKLTALDPDQAGKQLSTISKQVIMLPNDFGEGITAEIILRYIKEDKDIIVENPNNLTILQVGLSLKEGRLAKERHHIYKDIIKYRLFDQTTYVKGVELPAQTAFAASLGASGNPEDIEFIKKAIEHEDHFVLLGVAQAFGNLPWGDKDTVIKLCDTFLNRAWYFSDTDLLAAFYQSSGNLMRLMPGYFWDLYRQSKNKKNKVENLLPHIANYDLENGTKVDDLADEYLGLLHDSDIDLSLNAGGNIALFAKKYPEIYLKLFNEAINHTYSSTRPSQVSAAAYSGLGTLALNHPEIDLQSYYSKALSGPWEIKFAMIQGLPGLLATNPKEGIKILKPFLSDPNPPIRQAAEKALVDGLNLVLKSLVEEQEKLNSQDKKIEAVKSDTPKKENIIPIKKHSGLFSLFRQKGH